MPAPKSSAKNGTKSKSQSSTKSNILSRLRSDHREVASLFEAIDKTTARASRKRQDLFAELDTALSIHAEFEEMQVYPLITARKSDKDLGLEALEEHAQMKRLLAELRELDPQHERWMAKITVLKEDVRHHVKEEEGELFPALRKAASAAELVRLAEAYTTYRDHAVDNPALERTDHEDAVTAR